MTIVARNDGYSAMQGDSTIREANFVVSLPGSRIPPGATQVTASSGNVANTSAVAALPAVAGKTNYVTGITITSGGATAAALVNATLAGVIGGTMTYTFGAPTGAAVAASPFTLQFYPPVAASAVNTAITLTLPALGAGNTNAAVTIQGFVV